MQKIYLTNSIYKDFDEELIKRLEEVGEIVILDKDGWIDFEQNPPKEHCHAWVCLADRSIDIDDFHPELAGITHITHPSVRKPDGTYTQLLDETYEYKSNGWWEYGEQEVRFYMPITEVEPPIPVKSPYGEE